MSNTIRTITRAAARRKYFMGRGSKLGAEAPAALKARAKAKPRKPWRAPAKIDLETAAKIAARRMRRRAGIVQIPRPKRPRAERRALHKTRMATRRALYLAGGRR